MSICLRILDYRGYFSFFFEDDEGDNDDQCPSYTQWKTFGAITGVKSFLDFLSWIFSGLFTSSKAGIRFERTEPWSYATAISFRNTLYHVLSWIVVLRRALFCWNGILIAVVRSYVNAVRFVYRGICVLFLHTSKVWFEVCLATPSIELRIKSYFDSISLLVYVTPSLLM